MTAPATATTPGGDRRWLIVAAMALPLMMLTIDAFGLTVALPSVGRSLDTSTATLAWVLNAFLLAFAAPQIAAGRLADTYGRRRVVLLGLAVFIVGSVLAATAQSAWWLIGARVVQGAGTALSFVTSLSIVSSSFPDARRGQAIGVWAAAGTIGQSVGPLAAGVLAETLGWRWFFLINVPLGLGAIALTLAIVPESRDETAPRGLDVPGFLAITGGIVLLVLGIQMSGQLGWGSPVVLGGLIGGVALVLLFLLLEPRVRTPLVDLTLFRNGTFLGAMVILFNWNWAWSAMMFFLTLYLQHIRDLSPVGTGLMFLAFAVPFASVSAVAGTFAARVGARTSILVGMAAAVVGSLIFALMAADAPLAIVGAGFVLYGLGGALAYNAAATAGLSSIPQAKAGTASGIQNTLLQVGAAFGLAVANALFKAVENDRLVDLLGAAGATLTGGQRDDVRGLLSGSDAAQAALRALAPAAADQVERIANTAFMDGLHAAMFLSVAVTAVALAATFAVKGATPAPAPPHPAPATHAHVEAPAGQ